MNVFTFTSAVSGLVLVGASCGMAQAAENNITELEDRIAALEAQNLQLTQMVEQLLENTQSGILRVPGAEEGKGSQVEVRSLVGTNASYSFAMLDHAENVNTKQIIQLKAGKNDALQNDLTFGGGLTVLANYQRSNRDDKFGYLMRNPTSANQIGKDVSEAVVHSAQLNATATLSDNLTGYVEILYNPEQSFGSGTITDLNRNQTQVRRAYLLWGNLDKSPWYASIGKMDTPFGLNDTVSPFTNSTVWHAFSGLAYGAQLGYISDALTVRAMAIQGGAQFRAHNSPVKGTNVPSRLNNFAIDANYTTNVYGGDILFGASYQHGSPYCQDFPIFHFNPCEENNPAYSVYSKAQFGALSLIGEFAETTDEWPGTQIPDPANALSQFGAENTRSWGLGGRYQLKSETFASLEFSRFKAGPSGAPWERQDQWVTGLSHNLTPSVNLFGEIIHVDGFAPLNFLTGGNFPDGSTWSDRDAMTNLILFGAQAAF